MKTIAAYVAVAMMFVVPVGAICYVAAAPVVDRMAPRVFIRGVVTVWGESIDVRYIEVSDGCVRQVVHDLAFIDPTIEEQVKAYEGKMARLKCVVVERGGWRWYVPECIEPLK